MRVTNSGLEPAELFEGDRKHVLAPGESVKLIDVSDEEEKRIEKHPDLLVQKALPSGFDPAL